MYDLDGRDLVADRIPLRVTAEMPFVFSDIAGNVYVVEDADGNCLEVVEGIHHWNVYTAK